MHALLLLWYNPEDYGEFDVESPPNQQTYTGNSLPFPLPGNKQNGEYPVIWPKY
jgi:hypothetical protein